jgi:hypothetical protein
VKKNAENSSTLVAQNVNSQDLKIRCSRLTDSQPESDLRPLNAVVQI